MAQGSTPFPNFVVTVSFAEAFGREADISELESLLRQFNRRDVVAALSKLNAALQTWRRLSVDTQMDEKIAKDVFARSVIQNVRRTSGDAPRRLYFPRLSILAAIKLALRICGNDGRPIESAQDVGLLLAGCMILNDLTPDAPHGNATADMISQLLPLYEFTSRTAHEADASRSIYMFEKLTPGLLASNPKGIDFPVVFTDALGVSPRTFAEFCFAIAAQYLNLKPDSLTTSPQLFLIEDCDPRGTTRCQNSRGNARPARRHYNAPTSSTDSPR